MLSIVDLYPLQNSLSRPISIFNIRMPINESIGGGSLETRGGERGGGRCGILPKKMFRKYIS